MRASLHIAADPGALIRPSRPAKWVAAQIGCDASRVRKLLQAGLLEGYKDGRAVRIYLDSVAAYQQRRPLGGSAPQAARTAAKPNQAALRQSINVLQSLGCIRQR